MIALVPYRSARAAGTKLTPDAGIALDMVRQFADRHAFLRELVQNGIDAGAQRPISISRRASCEYPSVRPPGSQP